jgi:hypothetical protein
MCALRKREKKNGTNKDRTLVAPLSSMDSKEQAMASAPIGSGESTAASRKLVGLGVKKERKRKKLNGGSTIYPPLSDPLCDFCGPGGFPQRSPLTRRFVSEPRSGTVRLLAAEMIFIPPDFLSSQHPLWPPDIPPSRPK